MGLFKKEGWNCRPGEDGKTTCVRFEARKNERVATGTEVNIGINEETCEPFFVGPSSMLDDDDSAIQEIAGKMSQACRKKKGM